MGAALGAVRPVVPGVTSRPWSLRGIGFVRAQPAAVLARPVPDVRRGDIDRGGWPCCIPGRSRLLSLAVLALNGQEWYHDTIGTEGRLGNGWAVWSTGGRLVTIALIFGAIFQATTGWGGQVGESPGSASGSTPTTSRSSRPRRSPRPRSRGASSTPPWPRGTPSPGGPAASGRPTSTARPTCIAPTTSPEVRRPPPRDPRRQGRGLAANPRRPEHHQRHDPDRRLADHLHEVDEQPELGPVLRRRRRGDVRPQAADPKHPGRRGLLQERTGSTPRTWPSSAPGPSPPGNGLPRHGGRGDRQRSSRTGCSTGPSRTSRPLAAGSGPSPSRAGRATCPTRRIACWPSASCGPP